MTDLTERTLEAVEREIERAEAWLATLRERRAELIKAERESMPTLPPKGEE